MIYDATGAMLFDDPFEMTYEVLNEMELEVRPDGSIYSPILHGLFFFNGLLIKASTDPNNIHYAGQGEIVLDLMNNVRIANMMFGHMIQKQQAEGMPFASFIVEEKTIEATKRNEEDYKVSCLTIKYDPFNEDSTNFYRNKCLKFVHGIFLAGDTFVDLTNLDNVIDITK